MGIVCGVLAGNEVVQGGSACCVKGLVNVKQCSLEGLSCDSSELDQTQLTRPLFYIPVHG